jgi:hypothetical protein
VSRIIGEGRSELFHLLTDGAHLSPIRRIGGDSSNLGTQC